MSRLTRDGTTEPISRDQLLRREHGQGNIDFPCSADHGQDWQPYPVDPYPCYMCDNTYIHVPDWQPRILLGMVEARSVDAKNTHTRFIQRFS